MRSKILLAGAAFCDRLVAAADFYVAPNRSDNNVGTSAAAPFQTPPKAQQAIRSQIASSMSENVSVHLASGTYTLSTSLKFTSDDSGKNGFTVKWVGESGALISGGRKITGWTAGSNSVYSASVPAGLKSRNLYVNGQAANYARKKVGNRKDFTYTDTGIKWTSSAYDWITSTAGIANAEIRFINPFTDRYAPITSAGNRELTMKQVWVQNALALLTDSRQFYLDSGAGKVYYKPLAGQNMDSVEVYLGVVETLVVVGGTYANLVHDISFEGISFAHTTWLQPNDISYIDQQTGGCLCENRTYTPSNFESTHPYWCQMPSAIQISAAKNILLSGGTYTQLGAGGIGIGNDDNAHVTGVGLGTTNVAVHDA